MVRQRDKGEEEEKPLVTPPVSLEAEQALLGAVLLRSEVMDEVSTILRVEDFYRTANGEIFKAIMGLYKHGEPIDLKTVTFLLQERSQLDGVGGPLFLAELSEHVGTAANATYYARLVHEKAMLRQLLAATQEIAQGCYSRVENVEEFIAAAEERIFQIKEERQAGSVYSLEDLFPEVKAQIERNWETKREVLGLPSGFTDLDRLTGGFQPADLILLAARPSMGKTAMALNMGYHAAVTSQVPTLFFSLEQPKEQLVQRLMAHVGQINAWRLRSSRLDTGEWTALFDLDDKFRAPLYIIDQPALTPLEIRAHSRRLRSKRGVGLVIVDYLQLMKEPKARSREQEVGGISRALKALAKELNVPVIALSQLNRDLEKRPKKYPLLSDLRESGSLEQDADLARFIHEGAEGRLPRLCFGGEEGNEGATRRWKGPRRVMFRQEKLPETGSGLLLDAPLPYG